MGPQYVFRKFMDRDARIREEADALAELVRPKTRASTTAGEMAHSEQCSLEIAMTCFETSRI